MVPDPIPNEELPARFWWRLVLHLKSRLTTGLLVVIPLGITIFILRFLFDLADGFFAPAITAVVAGFHAEAEYIPGLGMVSGLLVIYLAGFLTTNLLGRRLVEFGEALLTRIPLVKSIYTSSKQVTSVFSQGNSGSFRSAVLIPFPHPGVQCLAFVTGHVTGDDGRELVTVFVPTSPNPTSGYVVFLAEEQITPAPFGVEEAMKIIMSGGMVTSGQVANNHHHIAV